MKQVEVVAAILIVNDHVLCVQRGVSKLDYISCKWEFAGGKIEDGETHHQALRRELIEELDLKIDVKEKATLVLHQYPDFHLTLHAYLCSAVELKGGDFPKFILNEHKDYKWLKRSDAAFSSLDWAAADIPIVEELCRLTQG